MLVHFACIIEIFVSLTHWMFGKLLNTLVYYITFVASECKKWQDLYYFKPHLMLQATRIILLWVNNHFNDFESDPAMYEFLEHFECLLEREVCTVKCELSHMYLFIAVYCVSVF